MSKETGLIDYEALEEVALRVKPKMIICGASAYSRDWDYAKIRKVADQIGALILADISHPAGLIATKLLNDPLEHCHIITTTTHKTLRGPRGGIIMMRKNFDNPFGLKWNNGNPKSMAALLDAAVFPGIQGGPLEHVIAAKAVAFGEALAPEFTTYMKQVQLNARVMANSFIEKGYTIISGGTDNHSMLIDLRNKNINGKDAENCLVKADITINKNMVPFDTESPFITSGIRIGTAAITSRGVKENEIENIVQLIDESLIYHTDEVKLANIKGAVNLLMKDLPLFAW